MKAFRALSALTLIASLLSACVSVDENTAFLVRKLSEKAKARALIAEGTDLYRTVIVAGEQYDRIAEVREYFTTAGKMDPTNPEAKKYVSLLDDLKRTEFQESLAVAKRLIAKKSRTPDEDYAMVMAAQQANRFDPNSADVKKLIQDTAPIGNALAKTNIDRANAILQKIPANAQDPAKEAAYSDAFPLADRATRLAPGNGEAQGLLGRVKNELSRLARVHLAAVDGLIGKLNLAGAEREIAAADNLNQKVGGNFKGDIDNQRFATYFRWAQFHADRKEWEAAEYRIALALSTKKTPEAIALDRTIADRKAQADQGPNFDAQISSIDTLLSKGDLASAQARIDALAKNAKDGAQQTALADRRRSIQNALPDLYNRGVQFYRSENFKGAIEVLATLTAVAPSYQDAADYLRKAREKQKILDQF